MEFQEQKLFELPVELELRKSAGGNRRIVRGYASTETIDQDGESILQKGIDFSPLLKSGYVNYDHQYQNIAGARVPILIGVPRQVEFDGKGWIVESELFKSGDGGVSSNLIRLAEEMWDLGMALQKSDSDRKLAYSVEGGVIYRDPKNPKKIMKSVVRHVALTHKPVNEECTVDLFIKSLCCGRCNPDHPLYIPGHTCGSHASMSKEDKEDMQKSEGAPSAMSTESAAPLLRQNLDKGMTSVLYGDVESDYYDPTTGRFKDGLEGAVSHMTEKLGHTKDESVKFLKRLLQASAKDANIAALVTQAGFVKP